MIDVFISYSHRDQPIAHRLAEHMESRGLRVWWDDELSPAADFPNVLRAMIDASRVVAVLWSPNSVQSTYVHSEALSARSRKTYFGAMLEPELELPMPFNAIHAYAPTAIDTESRISDLAGAIAERVETSKRAEPARGGESEDVRSWLAALRVGTREAMENFLLGSGKNSRFTDCATQMAAVSGAARSRGASSAAITALAGVGGVIAGLVAVGGHGGGGGHPDTDHSSAEQLEEHAHETEDEVSDDDQNDGHDHDPGHDPIEDHDHDDADY